jgi:hypothetical protein
MVEENDPIGVLLSTKSPIEANTGENEAEAGRISRHEKPGRKAGLIARMSLS